MNFLGLFKKKEIGRLIADGAMVIDVRTPREFSMGSLPGSINSPIGGLEEKTLSLSKDEPIIVVCASGVRSAMGTQILKSKGYSATRNGGSWASLMKYYD